MGVILANNVASIIPNAVSSTDTTITVTSGTGSAFPTLGASDFVYLTIFGTNNSYEIVKCTARTDDTLTVVRGQEGTLAIPFSAGSRLELRVTVANIVEYVNASITASVNSINALLLE